MDTPKFLHASEFVKPVELKTYDVPAYMRVYEYLVHNGGKTSHEIAAALNIQYNTVRTGLFRLAGEGKVCKGAQVDRDRRQHKWVLGCDERYVKKTGARDAPVSQKTVKTWEPEKRRDYLTAALFGNANVDRRKDSKRTALLRKTPLRASSTIKAEPKPAKGPKQRKCSNRSCRQPYMPDPKQPFKTWCGPDCGTAIALERLAKQKAAKAKAERAADRRRKDEGMPHKDRLEAVQKLANRIAVLRDWNDGCISCDKGASWQGGAWHGSHYKSVGSNSALRFNLHNIHKACSQCNWHKAGNIADYEPRLALKLGSERLEWLKNHPRSREYSTEYLLRYASIARRWIKRREKRLGIR